MKTRGRTNCRARPYQRVVAGCTEGASTGPQTPGGLARSRKHGLYSAEAKAERRLVRQFLEDSRDLLPDL